MTSMQNSDIFGFYTIDDLKFYSKFDAIEFASKSDKNIKWNFNDNIFTKIDWTIEPTESLNEVYRQRAQQLRDSYDYLILWYSAGSDSDNILNTFVNNNIQLDEVASLVNYEATGDKNDWLNGEIYNLAIPKINVIRETTQPWIKYTIIDICQHIMNFFNSNKKSADWIYNNNLYLGPNNVAKSTIVSCQPQWLDLINSGKRVGFIWGLEKPKIINIHGSYNLIFKDILENAVASLRQINPMPGQFDELFYWSPDSVKLLAKQAHTIKRFLKTAECTSPYLSQHMDPRASCTSINGKLFWLTTAGTNKLLYPAWYQQPYQFKPESLIFSPRDQWFFDLPDSDTAKINWQQGIKHKWSQIPNSQRVNSEALAKGFRLSTSISYNLD
jgi:hypothetical protein